MTIARYLSAAASGTLMTLALFWLMQALIAVAPVQQRQKDIPPPVIAGIPPEQPPVRSVVPKRPDKLPLPPPRASVSLTETGSGIAVPLGIPTVLPAAFRPVAETDAGRDTPLVALVQVSPAYPPGAIRRGLDGYVVVEFDVTEARTVANVRVVESSDAAFERSAVEAARRLRFKPQVIDGVPSPAAGVRKLFRYRMEDG